MLNHVMVPLDGSEKDGRALAVGAALADLSGTDLHLVRVFDTPIESLSGRARALGVAAAAVELRDAMHHALAETADSLAADTGRVVTWEILDGGDVASVLTRHAAERGVRFLVMGTRASGAAGRAVRGSVADRVMRESTRPVVLVPPGADYMRGKRVQFGRVLIPLDGSALAAKSIDYLFELPQATKLEYVLLEVVSDGDRRARARAEERIDAAANQVRSRGAKAVEVAVLESSDPAAAIAGAVREALVDIIAMSTRGAGGLRRLVLGSVAEGVVRASEVPVMLLTPAYLGPG